MKNIAIFRRNGLGDLLATYPLIAYLKKENPHSVITLFLGEANSPIIPYLPYIDEIVITPKNGNKYFNLIYEVMKRRGRGFDLALSAKTSPMKLMNFALYASAAKEKRAYVDKAWHSRLVNCPRLYDHEIAMKQHQALRCLHLVAPHLTEVPEELYPRISLPASLATPFLDYFDATIPIIFISASTSRKENSFDGARYAAILNHLFMKSPFQVSLVSMPQDEPRAKLMARSLKMPYHLSFTQSFEAFLGLLQLSHLAFVGDGGVAHIAAALDKPQVVLFGQSHPINWHPLSKKTTVLYHPTHVNLLNEEEIFEALLCKINSL